ncbi:hypothetical protein BH23GEM9_BH23GEM9_35960 [soil metagenome]
MERIRSSAPITADDALAFPVSAAASSHGSPASPSAHGSRASDSVQGADASANGSPVSADAIAPAPGRFRLPWRGVRLLATAAATVLVIALGALAALAFQSEAPRTAHGTPITRVVILPFMDRSENAELESLASALTEALARSLSQSRPLDVVSQSGVAMLRARGVSEDSLRVLLRADYLVSGSVRSGDDRLTLSVELLDGRTGSLVLSDVVERSIADSRILVADVVDGTAALLRRGVSNEVEVQRVRSQTSSEEAWRAVLDARSLQNKMTRLMRHGDYASLLQALDQADLLLTRAGELDRKWAEPLIRRGWVMERRALFTSLAAPDDTASRRKLLEAGRSMADRARERDPYDPRAHELRGVLLHQLAMLPGVPTDTVRDRLAMAEQELRRATELDVNSSSAWRRLADLHSAAGQYASAKNAAERAWEIDRYMPEVHNIVNLLFATSLELGEDADAFRWCMEGRRTSPTAPPFVYCLFALHAWSDPTVPEPALLRREFDLLKGSAHVPPPEVLVRLETLIAIAHARIGQQDSARAILQRTAAAAEPGLIWLQAAAALALGDEAAALKALAGYLAAGDWESQRVARFRPFRSLRGRPEYERLFESRAP